MKTIKNSKGVNEENSNGVNSSYGVNRSNGVNWSYGVNSSYGVNRSNGVNWSYGVNSSDGVNWSNGVNSSDGVNWSNGVNRSYGVNSSDGVNWSYGVINSFGVSNAIFMADKKREYTIFGLKVSEKRFNEVLNKIYSLADGWYPKFNNAFELYLKNGSDWKKVDASSITSKLDDWEKPYEAWKDMPKPLLDYIKSLEEFNDDIFKRVTGIDIKEKTDDVTQEAIQLLKDKGYKIVKD